jgi:Xaa-Pro aminopeptidase
MLIPNDYFPPFSEQEYANRRRTIRASMKEKGLECLIIYGAYHWGGTDTGQVNAVYLSNYTAIPHSYVVLPLSEDPTLFISFAYHITNAKDCAAIEDVRVAGFDLINGVGARLKELGLEKGKIGIVGPLPSWWTITLPHEHHEYLTKTFPNATFETVTDWYEDFRLMKSEEEIARMERAGLLCDVAHEEVVLASKPGVRHSDLRAIMDGVANRFGGRYPFSHIGSTSMTNPDRFYPDFFPTHQTLEAGHVVMTEVALGYGLYFGKIWGTYFIGEPTKDYRTLFETSVAVHDKAIAEIKPGMTGKDINKWVEPFRKAGWVTGLPLLSGWSTYNHRPHAGVVEDGKTPSRLTPRDLDWVYKPGQCVTIVAFPIIPGTKKGLWVGTTCVFTKDGLKKLHAYPVTKLRVVPV